MYVPKFNYHKPDSLKDACKILNENKNAALLAGGTDILVELKKGLLNYDDLISIKNLKELKILEEDKKNIIIGSAVTHSEIKNSTLIKNKLPVLSKAAASIGTEQIRNTGTIGGNICTGASCCDMAPALLVYGALVEIFSISEKKIIPITEFFIDHHKTFLKKGEILTKIIVPIPTKNMGISFFKFGLRDAAAISVASVGVMLNFEKGKCTDSKIAIGAVSPAPKLSNNGSGALIGLNKKEISNVKTLQIIGEAVANDVLPINDIRGSADYRRNVMKILTQRAILEAVNQIKN